MSARHGEWELLEHSSDPVPGDPSRVLEEANDYATLATTIANQANRLRRLADPDTSLKGDYAEVLREEMTELAGELDKIDERFSTVASKLKLFEPVLDTARTQTMSALDDAVNAQDTIDDEKKAEAEAEEPTHRPPFEKTPGEKALEQARSDCQTALEEFDEAANRLASDIRDAADDAMKDPSGWKKFLSDAWDFTVKALKVISKVAQYVGIALAIASLFIPGVNFFTAFLVVGLISLTANSILAATGNGSWTDVVFDIAGLATLGAGRLLTSLAKTGRLTTITRAAKGARTSAFRQTAWNGGRGLRGFVSRFRPSVRTAMRTAYDDVMRLANTAPRPAPATGFVGEARNTLFHDAAAYSDDLAALTARFPDVKPSLLHTGATKGLWIQSTSSAALDTHQMVTAGTDTFGMIDPPQPSEVRLVSGGR